MNRIAIFDDYWARPKKVDFESYNAYILLDRLLVFHVSNPDGGKSMILPYKIEEIAIRNKIDTGYKEFMYQYVDNLPENVWHQVIKELILNMTDVINYKTNGFTINLFAVDALIVLKALPSIVIYTNTHNLRFIFWIYHFYSRSLICKRYGFLAYTG